jgi:hypothetical protein
MPKPKHGILWLLVENNLSDGFEFDILPLLTLVSVVHTQVFCLISHSIFAKYSGFFFILNLIPKASEKYKIYQKQM